MKAQARELYSYDKSVSIFKNEQRFLANLKRDCKSYGNKKFDDLLTPAEYLETYPKDITYYFLSKNVKQICYYGLSISLKYLNKHHQKDTETMLTSLVESCLRGESTYKACEDYKKTFVLFDTAVLLGNYCTQGTLNVFKKLNCRYKDLKNKECTFYQSVDTPTEECPFQYSSKVEVSQLHKSYFSSGCKLKWRAPACIY